MTRVFKAILPGPAAKEFAPDAVLFAKLADKIKSRTPPPNISEVMGEVEKPLDASIAAEGYVIAGGEEEPLVDLSQIDFEVFTTSSLPATGTVRWPAWCSGASPNAWRAPRPAP